jgi:hypothetical protein
LYTITLPFIMKCWKVSLLRPLLSSPWVILVTFCLYTNINISLIGPYSFVYKGLIIID